MSSTSLGSSSDIKDLSPDPYRQFLSLASFVASVGLGLSLGSSFSLSSATSFHGRSDADTLAKLYHCSLIFAWSAATYGLGLVISLPGQVLVTSPHFINIYKDRSTHLRRRILKLVLSSMSWLSLGLVTAGTALVGEGLKIINVRAGQLLQWTLLAVGFPLLSMWVFLRHENFILAVWQKLTSKSRAVPKPVARKRDTENSLDHDKPGLMYNGP